MVVSRLEVVVVEERLVLLVVIGERRVLLVVVPSWPAAATRMKGY